jgi:hypothetical protein
MRDLVYTGFVSLDGVLDWPGGGPGEEHRSGGWVVKDIEFLPEAFSLKGEELEDTTALMFGRRSYECGAGATPGRSRPDRPVPPSSLPIGAHLMITTVTRPDNQNHLLSQCVVP